MSSKRVFAAGAIGGNLSAACDAINNADKIALKIGENDLSRELFDLRNKIASLLPRVEALMESRP